MILQMNNCYLCYSTNDQVRRASTSGGLFYELAKYAIEKQNAIVFGAAFNDKFHVGHIAVDKLSQLDLLQGSKYPQSDMRDVYASIWAMLQAGRTVVFSGTPCQCAAIRKYVGPNEHLFLIDLICYGVASPGVWENYLNEYFHKKTICAIRFKDKTYGWKNWQTCIETPQKNFFLKDATNPFMKYYLAGLYVRPSCMVCPFKGDNRFSDITIGDAWGEGEKSELNDNQGLSIAITHSKIGGKWLEELKGETEIKEVDFHRFIAGNPYYFRPPSFDLANREYFFSLWQRAGFKKAFQKLCIPHKLKKLPYYFALWRGVKRKNA